MIYYYYYYNIILLCPDSPVTDISATTKDLYRKTRLLILDVYAVLRAGGLDEEGTLRSRRPPHVALYHIIIIIICTRIILRVGTAHGRDK